VAEPANATSGTLPLEECKTGTCFRGHPVLGVVGRAVPVVPVLAGDDCGGEKLVIGEQKIMQKNLQKNW
jgi:hypothetical protein